MAGSLVLLHSDARILEMIRQGNEEALVTLYKANRRMVTSLVRHNSGTSDDAEDVLQEAVIVLWERVRAGRFDAAAKLSTFLFATARNIWLRRLARARREQPSDSIPDQMTDDALTQLDALIETEDTRTVQDALARLGEPCRTLLVLFYWEEASMEEIAARLGFANADTAKSKKYQCKKALEKLLVDEAA